MSSAKHLDGPMTVASSGRARDSRRRALTGGGPNGNEQLTASVSVLVLLALAVLGPTVLRIGQLISVHLFVGMLLLGPVALKMASTGYRFTRYYTRSVIYREKGPPEVLLRAIAPVVVVTTVVVFASFDACQSSYDLQESNRGACRARRPAASGARSRSPARWSPGWCWRSCSYRSSARGPLTGRSRTTTTDPMRAISARIPPPATPGSPSP
jgi:hypothetical protein